MQQIWQIFKTNKNYKKNKNQKMYINYLNNQKSMKLNRKIQMSTLSKLLEVDLWVS